jgi:UDP-3-O-[3-hydroxymyristoyl] glucosamine N-acyltransferase
MTAKSKVRLGDLFPELGLIGDFDAYAGVEVSRISSPETADPGCLVFLSQERLLPYLLSARPAAFVLSDSLWDKASSFNASSPLLRSRDAMLAFAKASRFFSAEPQPPAGIHPHAQVHSSALIGEGASIGPFTQVGEGAEIGPRSILHSNVSVGAGAKVGAGCVLFPGVVLYHGVLLGDRVRIHANSVIGSDGFGYVQEKAADGVRHVKIHHLGTVRIGSDVEIGASTSIDRGTLEDTTVGDGTIIDNQVQIGHNCRVGRGVILCGCVGLSGSVIVEDFALIAGMTGVSNKVKIGMGAQVTGFSGINGDVPAGAKWGGLPAMERGEYARRAVLFKRLPEVFEFVKQQKKEGKA